MSKPPVLKPREVVAVLQRISAFEKSASAAHISNSVTLMGDNSSFSRWSRHLSSFAATDY